MDEIRTCPYHCPDRNSKYLNFGRDSGWDINTIVPTDVLTNCAHPCPNRCPCTCPNRCPCPDQLCMKLYKNELHLSNKISVKQCKNLRKKNFRIHAKICSFAPTWYAPSRLHQVDIAPSLCTNLIYTKSILHQVD